MRSNRRLGNWTNKAREIGEGVNNKVKETLVNYYTECMSTERTFSNVGNAVEDALTFK